MDFSEKLLTLRKSRDLTQEQLAERLDVSRQSVSKWESGQAVPELDKIIALSDIFDVTTDYLLKPSEIDELSVKTEILAKQQEQMLIRERKRSQILHCVLYAVGVYLLFFAVYFIGHFYFEIWNASVIFSEFLIATAIVIFICVKHMDQSREKNQRSGNRRLKAVNFANISGFAAFWYLKYYSKFHKKNRNVKKRIIR